MRILKQIVGKGVPKVISFWCSFFNTFFDSSNKIFKSHGSEVKAVMVIEGRYV
ncbi:MAG: hypothetical protein SOZ71_05920 [Clostridium sp.]|nr:hypothetical protein [Clostridium sp.]